MLLVICVLIIIEKQVNAQNVMMGIPWHQMDNAKLETLMITPEQEIHCVLNGTEINALNAHQWHSLMMMMGVSKLAHIVKLILKKMEIASHVGMDINRKMEDV